MNGRMRNKYTGRKRSRGENEKEGKRNERMVMRKD
jgi:hypothetical protein